MNNVETTLKCLLGYTLSKALGMLYRGSVRWGQRKKCYFMFTYTFYDIFCSFSSKKMCFYHFQNFSWWSIKLPQQNINLSENRTSDKKLPVKLCDNSLKLHNSRSQFFWCSCPVLLDFFTLTHKFFPRLYIRNNCNISKTLTLKLYSITQK